MRKTKFYAVFAAFVIAMFAAFAAAVAFIAPQKSVAKAEETTVDTTYKYADGIKGLSDTNRDENNLYFGVRMPEKVKPGETFDISLAILNRAAGVFMIDFDVSISANFTINEYSTTEVAGKSFIPGATLQLFNEGSAITVNSATKAHLSLSANFNAGLNVTETFVELATFSITASDMTPETTDSVHYYMSWNLFETTITGWDEESMNNDEGAVPWSKVKIPTYNDGTSDVYGCEIVVGQNVSEDVTLASGYPIVTAPATLTGTLGTASQEWQEDNPALSEGAPNKGGMRHTTYQSYDISTKLSYSTNSLTVEAKANDDSVATVKMLTNPAGATNSDRYTVVEGNKKTFDISAIDPNVTNPDEVASNNADPVYEEDDTHKYYKYTLEYAFEVLAEANGYVRIYSITYYKEKEAPSEIAMTLESVSLVSKDNSITYNSTYDEASKTYTIVGSDNTTPLTMSYVDAKQDEWQHWSIVAVRTHTGSEVTTTGDGVKTLTTGTNTFTITLTHEQETANYTVKVNVAAANTDKSLSSVIIKNKFTPSNNFNITANFNPETRVYTAEAFTGDKLGETWMVEAEATKGDLATVSYTVLEKVLTAGENALYIRVTDQLFDYVDYTVIITVTANDDTTLKDFKVNDLPLTKGPDGKYSYKFADTVSQFTLYANATAASSTVAVYNNGTPVERVEDKYLIIINLSDTVKTQEILVSVRSESNTVSTYTLVITRLSADATLKKAYIKNASNKTYEGVVDNNAHTITISGLTYRESLDASGWALYGEPNQEGAQCNAKALTSFSGNTLTVTAESGAAVNYTVTINNIAGDENAELRAVYITNGTDRLNAVVDNTAKTCVISGMTYAQSKESWTLYATTRSNLASCATGVVLTSLDGNTITVTPEKGAAVNYTLTINVTPGDTNTALKAVYISNGTDQLMATIDNDAKICVIDGMTYLQSQTDWTLYVQAESPLAQYTAQVELTSLDGNKITVTPEKGDAVDYTLTINRLPVNTDSSVIISVKSGNTNIDLKVNGKTYYAVVNYDEITSVSVNVATSDLAVVEINDTATRTANVTLAAGDTVVAIDVTAQNGTTSEYSVIISAYTEADVPEENASVLIEISGGVTGKVTQNEYISNGYLFRDKSVKNGVKSITFKFKVPEYINVKAAYGSSAIVTKTSGQTADLAAASDGAASGSTSEYTVSVKTLKEGANSIALEFTDTRTGVSKTFVQNINRDYKSNGALIAFLVIFLLLFVAVTVLLVLSVLGIINLKNLFSKLFSKKEKKVKATETADTAETVEDAEATETNDKNVEE